MLTDVQSGACRIVFDPRDFVSEIRYATIRYKEGGRGAGEGLLRSCA